MSALSYYVNKHFCNQYDVDRNIVWRQYKSASKRYTDQVLAVVLEY